MAKLYTTTKKNQSLNPKQKTISFLLSYSKSITELKTRKSSFRIHLN
jgi:hypothetical protein